MKQMKLEGSVGSPDGWVGPPCRGGNRCGRWFWLGARLKKHYRFFGDLFWLGLPQKVRCEKKYFGNKKEEFLGRQTF